MKERQAVIKNVLWKGETVILQGKFFPTRLFIKSSQSCKNQKLVDYLLGCRKVLCKYSKICFDYSAINNWNGYECSHCPKFYQTNEVFHAEDIVECVSDDDIDAEKEEDEK